MEVVVVVITPQTSPEVKGQASGASHPLTSGLSAVFRNRSKEQIEYGLLGA